MKKIAFLLFGILLLSLVGCTNRNKVNNVYSFSGERDEFRVINGVVDLGGEDISTFYGGELEIKRDDFKNIKEYSTRFYIEEGKEEWTILNNSTKHVNGTFELTNQELGQIFGAILKTNSESKSLEEHLCFELIVTYENGKKETFKIPMHVEPVLKVQKVKYE